ncbi:MAG: N-acetyl sugar amidotransferase [Candidatus Omnitrophota bacterium]
MKPEESKEECQAYFGLPPKVVYCKKCVESNQRMLGSVQHKDTPTTKKRTVLFDDEGVCLACRYYEKKKMIDWEERERELRDLLNRHRRKDGYYDVLVPGSGGKDSAYVAHMLKYKYGMNPLTVTWAPHIYTEIGWKNFQAWIHTGFDNVLFTPNGKVHRKLTGLAFENLLHPFQPFVIGQYNLAPKIALEKGIKLIFFGDSYAERGFGGDVKWDGPCMDPKLFTREQKDEIFLGGVPIKDLSQYGINMKELNPYLPAEADRLLSSGIEFHVMPYYMNYDPQKNFYYAIEHTGFSVNPDGRTPGTYSKYASLDDKVDDFHYYTWFIKTGRGRCTEDASIEIRNNHITREEGVSLVRRFDGEFPERHFKDFLEYIGITKEKFWDIIDRYRSPHLWEKIHGEWKLKFRVS